MYNEEGLHNLYESLNEYTAKSSNLTEILIIHAENIGGFGHEHLVYGVARRLGVICESINCLFTLAPPETREQINSTDRSQSEAFLHAFLINCYGIFDNIAWFIYYQKSLDSTEYDKRNIGVFKKQFKRHLTVLVKEKATEHKQWYKSLTQQRHPTAHRIPPYIIPYIRYRNGVDYTPHYIHSLSEGRGVPLHQQSLVDMGTVMQFIETLIEDMPALLNQ